MLTRSLLWAAVIASLLLAAGASATANGRVLEGSLEGGHGTVRARVVKDGGRPVAIRLEFRDVPLRCDDGDTDIAAGIARTLRLEHDRRFQEQFHSQTLSERLAAIEGRLVNRSSARGRLLYYFNPPDAPGTTTADQECATPGWVRWKAGAR